MGKFERGGSRFGSDRGGDRGGRGGSRFGSDRGERGAVEMHKATCADCGKRCEVPFKPTGERPVYCSDCFSNQAGGSSRPERRSFDRPSFGDRGDRSSFDRPKFKATCDKCGEECEVPFKPTQGKPVFCNDCFGKDGSSDRGESRGRSSAGSNDQLAAINFKLDRLLKILAPVAKAMNVEEEVVAPVEKKAAKAKEEKVVVAEEETAKLKKEKKVAAKKSVEKVEKKVVAKKKK